MTRLLLIRHGQTFSNLTQSLDTALPGAALTDLGWEQSRAAGERIAREQESGLLVASSQALRAQQTASGILEGAAERGLELPAPAAVPGIAEIPAGDLEMRNDAEAHYTYHRTFGQWLGGSLDLVLPGAISGRDVVERYLDGLLPMVAQAQERQSDVAVVSHGAVIRLIAGYLGRVDPEYAVRTVLPNTARVELAVPGVLLTDDPKEALAEEWKIVDWAGHGEPPRVQQG